MYRVGREFCLVMMGGSSVLLFMFVSYQGGCNYKKQGIRVQLTGVGSLQQQPGVAVTVESPSVKVPEAKIEDSDPNSNVQRVEPDVEKVVEEEEPKKDLPPCPERSPHLRKNLRRSVQRPVSPESLELFFCSEMRGPFPPLKDGGVYRPDDCKAKQRVAIIIPYRNRYEHLHIQLRNLFPVLRRQQADFRFFIIEQHLPTTFNQGMLFNIGFLEAKTYDKFDCFIFSDVDLLPLSDDCLYQCHDENPFQLTAAISKWLYDLPYDDYYGGIVAFTQEQFETINGFSNLYFGWGGIDDDLLRRVRAKRYKKTRYTRAIGMFDMIKHVRDKGNPPNTDRRALLRDATTRQDNEGLNSATSYTRTKVEILPLYTWIHVTIDMMQTLKNVPETTQFFIRGMYADAKKFEDMATKDANPNTMPDVDRLYDGGVSVRLKRTFHEVYDADAEI